MPTTRIRSKRQAEHEAHEVEREREWQEQLRQMRTTGPYHSFGIEGIGAQSVCHLCGAVVQNRETHTEWHASMGQEMPV